VTGAASEVTTLRRDRNLHIIIIIIILPVTSLADDNQTH